MSIDKAASVKYQVLKNEIMKLNEIQNEMNKQRIRVKEQLLYSKQRLLEEIPSKTLDMKLADLLNKPMFMSPISRNYNKSIASSKTSVVQTHTPKKNNYANQNCEGSIKPGNNRNVLQEIHNDPKALEKDCKANDKEQKVKMVMSTDFYDHRAMTSVKKIPKNIDFHNSAKEVPHLKKTKLKF